MPKRFAASLMTAVCLLLTALGSVSASTTNPSGFEQSVARAALEFNVPIPVLKAVSYSETGWVDHGGEPSLANGYGVMHLQDNPYNDSLINAAEILNLSPDVLKADMLHNLRGGAALLSTLYREAYPDDLKMKRARDINMWYDPVARYLRSPVPAKGKDFADYVYEVLADGASASVRREVITLSPVRGLAPEQGAFKSVKSRKDQIVDGSYFSAAVSSAEEGADTWSPSANFDAANRGVGSITEVVIHTCEGGYDGCVTTLKNTQKDWCKPGDPTVDCRVSAHYVVRSSDGYVTQLVLDKDIAWHATSHNPYSVGIEHEGWVKSGNTWYTDTMYRESAWVTAWRFYKYSFSNMVSHSSFDPNKSDPGSYWDWTKYRNYVNQNLDVIRQQSRQLSIRGQ